LNGCAWACACIWPCAPLDPALALPEAVADVAGAGAGVAEGAMAVLTLLAPLEPGVAFCTFWPDGAVASPAGARGVGAGVEMAAPTLFDPLEPGVAFCTWAEAAEAASKHAANINADFIIVVPPKVGVTKLKTSLVVARFPGATHGWCAIV
jgi:hypothetical protein